MIKLSTIFIFAFALFAIVAPIKGHGDHEDDEEHEMIFYKLTTTELPMGLSDMTATLMDSFRVDGDEAVILVGGCSGSNTLGYYGYACTEITNKAYVFYTSTESFNDQQVADMPYARYRHTASLVDGKVFIIGGRTLMDEVIKEIVVYDPIDDSWSSFMELPDDYAVSDHAAVVKDGYIYVMAGYDQVYNPKVKTFTINVQTKQILDLAPMQIKRGDASAVYYNKNGIEAIYIMGGFTDANDWCAPITHGEKYNFKTNQWSGIPPLNHERGDKSVVVFEERILAIGGETKHDSYCAADSDLDPSSYSVAVDDVESFNPQDGDDAAWEVEFDFSTTRFRAVAAASTKFGKVYVFGGQADYDPSCQCYETSKDIFYFRDHDSGGSVAKVGFAFGIVGVVVAMLL
jgi:hypothetical protein